MAVTYFVYLIVLWLKALINNFSVMLECIAASLMRNSIPNIMKTCPCNVYPLEPHFYIAKLGYAGVYLFFLFLLQNIDCGYSLEPPQ